MNTFEDYIEDLCRQHPLIRHEADGKCHFSLLTDDSQTRFAQTMRYPCVVLDVGDFNFSGQPGHVQIDTEFSILFLEHVRDTGNSQDVQQAFSTTRSILLDFARKFSRDKRALKHQFLARFELIGSEGHRLYFKDAGLYGYALFFNNNESFSDADCDHIFD